MKIYSLFVTFTCILLITACLPKKNDPEIVKLEFNAGEYASTLFIPQVDFHPLANKTAQDGTGFLMLSFPDLLPINRDNFQQEKASFIIQQSPKPTPVDILTEKKRISLRANRLVNELYGLKHYSQSIEDDNQDAYDIYINYENKEIPFYLTCSEKILETDNPQCSLTIKYKTLSIRSSFSKKNLIKTQSFVKNINKLLASYASQEASKEHLQKRINLGENND